MQCIPIEATEQRQQTNIFKNQSRFKNCKQFGVYAKISAIVQNFKFPNQICTHSKRTNWQTSYKFPVS